MQAIITKYRGATNTRGSHIVATAAAGRVTMPYDHALDLEANHAAAANKLMAKLEWTQTGIQIAGTGCLPCGNYCHVLALKK